MADLTTPVGATGRCRPGGRSARVRATVLAAALELLEERGFESVELPDVARRAGVHPTTVYRRWGSKARLVGEALIEQSRPLSPTPDSGALRTDLELLLVEGGRLRTSPAVRALFQVLFSVSGHVPEELREAREMFVAAHVDEVRAIVKRAVAREELAADTDLTAMVELLIGPAIVRVLLFGQELEPSIATGIVDRALAALRTVSDEGGGASGSRRQRVIPADLAETGEVGVC